VLVAHPLVCFCTINLHDPEEKVPQQELDTRISDHAFSFIFPLMFDAAGYYIAYSTGATSLWPLASVSGP
jgi:hypothetical protein